ncbi:MAG: PLP-dependent lyase/thiolase [Candidatus Shapirobacteria bacterium]
MTPLVKIGNVYFKREDLNITGSAKDRSLEIQVKNLVKHKFLSAVISSTGNAAISAQYFCRKYGINLTIFVSPHTDKSKLKLIANYIVSSRPISDAFKFAKENRSYLLRQSTDPTALRGYSKIATEIIKQLPEVSSIFVPVGSGTTLLGISQKIPNSIPIFAVQPASHCPIASIFDHDFIPEKSTITDALGVKLIPLKTKIIKTINDHQGQGIVIQNKQIIQSQNYLIANNIITSTEGALALAGLNKIKSQVNLGFFPVIILTGAKR